MRPLESKVSLVTGASRGIGRGIAVGLGEAGATVFLTGKSSAETPSQLGGTIDETAAEVTHRGGRGIPVRCDHMSDAQVEASLRGSARTRVSDSGSWTNRRTLSRALTAGYWLITDSAVGRYPSWPSGPEGHPATLVAPLTAFTLGLAQRDSP
jgi:NAD(P)-dependent dehydrogenase (short-subunit alcohol dehydrogenase family)